MKKQRIGIDLIGARGGVATTAIMGLTLLQDGVLTRNGLVSELKGKVKIVLAVGDAVRPRQALQATREGFVAGLSV